MLQLLMLSSVKKLFFLGIFLLIPLVGTGCTLQSQKVSASPSKTKSTSSQFFSSKDIQPEGNSILHYLDSRLHKLQSEDPQALDAMRKAVGADSRSSYLHAELSRHLAEADQFEQATLESDKALELNPNDPTLHLLRGKLHSVKKMGPQAIGNYEECIRIQPEEEECYTMMAREYVVEKNVVKARDIIRQYLKINPDSASALYFLGTLYTQNEKEFPQAVRLFNQVLEEDPKNLKALIALSQIYINQKNYPKALETLLSLEQQAPNDVATKLRVGLLYYEQNNYPEAIKRFTRVLQLNPDNDRVQYYLGILEAQNKNLDQAAKYFTAVPESSTFYKDARIRLAVVLEELGRTQEAIQYTQEALEHKKDVPDLYDLLGSLYSKEEKYDQAIKAYDQGLAKFPNHDKLLFNKGVLLDKMGEFEKSMEIMKTILRANPDHPMALNYLGYSYVDRDINLQEALEMLIKANQLKPDDGYITDSLAWAYYKLGQTDKALTLLKKANQLSPDEPTILEHLGDVYLKLGQNQTAKDFYRQAVTAAVKTPPQDERERKDLERIQGKLAKMEH